ncbi:helix-turn-helix domain-containing protein [Streptomyces chartreusis]|uniref:helix-turn-helix domain-containing protein n=1 Tax=Streptomyces chartreusis TaxID=1969 RepID=UPI003648E662
MASPHLTGRDGGARRAGCRHIALVRLLAAFKESCGLTFTELAARTAAGPGVAAAVSASTLKRAVSLDAVPREHVVAAFSRACGATAEEEREALKLWRAARAEDRGILATLRAPSVTNIRTAQDLITALAATYERAGAPALRLVQERATTDQADGALLLPLTTLWRITRREGSGPATWEQCEAYLRGCGVHSVRMRLWREAFTRARTPVAADPGDLGELTRANLGRLPGGGPGAAKISKRFRALLNRMTSQEVETALTVGTAYLATEGARSYTATPTTFDHIFRELFLPGEPGTGQGDAVAPFRRAKAATPAPDGLSRADRPSSLPVVVTHVLGAEARRNGTAPDAVRVRDGSLSVIELKRYSAPEPPAPGSTPARPRVPGPSGSPGQARRTRHPAPAPA